MSLTSYRAAPPRVKMRSAGHGPRVRGLCSNGGWQWEGRKSVAFHEPVTKPRQKATMMGAAGGADDSFGDGLAAAARSIIADARRALTDPELTDAEAVHEVRKALKRWRALLRLLARPLGEQADQMRDRGARADAGAVAGARDAQSALDALADLRKADVPFSPTSMETIRAAADRHQGRGRADRFHQGHARPAVALSRLCHALARALAAQGDRFRHRGRRADLDLPARAAAGAGRTGRMPTPSICTICAGAWSSIAIRWI